MKGILALFYGIVRNGKLALENKEGFERTLQSYEGREVAVWLKPAEQIRTSAENRYYWGVIVRMIAEEMGIIPDDAHDFLKNLFLKVGVEKNGKRWEIARSTATLSVNEFEDYCEKVRMWAASELETQIPLPNEIILET